MTVTGDRKTGVWQAYASRPVFPVLAGLSRTGQATGSAVMASALNHRMRAWLGPARFPDRRPPGRR